MALNFIDQKIRKSFSDAAAQYDVLTGMHNEIGRELLKKVIDTDLTDSILDIGMGTGRLTRRLKFYFPESQVIGMDFAEGMIEIAKNKGGGEGIIQADAAALPFKSNSFNVIVSNLAFQWIRDLSSAFKLCLSFIHI